MPPTRYHRKIIRIRAEDSPNVRLALAEQAAGKVPSGRVILPGVLPWDDYVKRRAMWDKVRQTIGLDGIFYEGSELLLFPPVWLDHAGNLWHQRKARGVRRAKGIGVDPAEGGASTSLAAGDELGLIEIESHKTPNTAVIPTIILDFMRRHQVDAEHVAIDRGGGGKQHADRLREWGYNVRTVAFGESISLDPKRGLVLIETRMYTKEEKYTYKRRREQMYGELSRLVDPNGPGGGWAIPPEEEGEVYAKLREQLAPIPLKYDPEGRLELPPKHKRDPKDTTITLVDIIGYSPDEADAVVLAVHAMQHKSVVVTAGAAW